MSDCTECREQLQRCDSRASDSASVLETWQGQTSQPQSSSAPAFLLIVLAACSATSCATGESRCGKGTAPGAQGQVRHPHSLTGQGQVPQPQLAGTSWISGHGHTSQPHAAAVLDRNSTCNAHGNG